MALSLQRYTRSDSDSNLTRLLKLRSKTERELSTRIAIAIKNGDRLPENLIIEILSLLPVKDLLRFKTVCKSWYDIISSSQFISKHLKNNPKINQNCLLAHYYPEPGELNTDLQLLELLIDESPRVLAYDVLYSMPMCGSYVYGPYDGIYYLYEFDTSNRALWNPTINELRTLPPIISNPNPPINTTYAKKEVYGFGLDPIRGDYKVVVITGYWSIHDDDVNYPLSVLVYSLKTNSWKYCGDLSGEYDLVNNFCYVFVNGCCFWLGESPYEVIISFDVACDSYKEINVPNYKKPASNCLGIFENSLAFISFNDDEKNLDAWTLNEGIWSKKVAIGPFQEFQTPVGYWKDNMLLLEGGNKKLVLCDPNTGDMKHLGFEKYMWCQGIFGYMESLVSVKEKNDSKEEEDVGAGISRV